MDDESPEVDNERFQYLSYQTTRIQLDQCQLTPTLATKECYTQKYSSLFIRLISLIISTIDVYITLQTV